MADPAEPPLPTIQPVPGDAHVSLPFDLSLEGVCAVVLVLALLFFFYMALRPDDPLRTDLDPVPVDLPDDYVRQWYPVTGEQPIVRDENERREIIVQSVLTRARGRVGDVSIADERTTKIGRHRAFEEAREVRSHRRPAPWWLRRMGYAAGFIGMCAVAVGIGIALVFLLEG